MHHHLENTKYLNSWNIVWDFVLHIIQGLVSQVLSTHKMVVRHPTPIPIATLVPILNTIISVVSNFVTLHNRWNRVPKTWWGLIIIVHIVPLYIVLGRGRVILCRWYSWYTKLSITVGMIAPLTTQTPHDEVDFGFQTSTYRRN